MLSWALGIFYAVIDWLLLRLVIKKASQRPEQAHRLVMGGLLGRYLLTIGVLTFALLMPQLDPLGVVVPLILQKVAAVGFSLLPNHGGRSSESREEEKT